MTSVGLTARVRSIAGDEPMLPWMVLFLLFLFDEFDTAATNVLAPTLKDAFDVSDSALVLIALIGTTVVLAFSLPVGHLGDRVPRRSIAMVGAVIAGTCSLLTGFAPTFLLVAAARIGNGIGQLINESVHPSLLADYYRPETRPRVFAAHRSAQYLGAIVGSAVAGVLGTVLGWRFAFGVLFIPMAIVVVLGATRMREPRRGATDEPPVAWPGGAVSRDELERVSRPPFREASRTLWAIPTIRRLYVAQAFLGAAVIPIAIIGPILLSDYYGVGELGRGFIAGLYACASLAGVALGGRFASRMLDEGRGLEIAGESLALVGIGLALVASTPSLAVTIALSVATNFCGSFGYPFVISAQARVSPPHVRTLSFSFGAVFLVGGVWVLYFATGIAAISDRYGPRWGVLATAPFFVTAGLLQRSAGRLFADELLRLGRARQPERTDDAVAGGPDLLLTCRNVEVAYDQVKVLFGVDIDVRRGECVALLGTNGAGKSTLLRAISGSIHPSGGTIRFDGRELSRADPVTVARAGVVHVPGGRAVFPTLTVAEHMRIAGWLYRDDPDHLRGAVEQVFVRFPRLRERSSQLAGDLSGGEQQMLALGMALIAKPRLLMIDELSLGLAPSIVEQLLKVVRDINANGTAVLIVEQSLNVAVSIAERAYFLEKGRVHFEGATSDLLKRDDIARSVFFASATNTLAATPSVAARGSTGAASAAPDLPLEVIDLHLSFGGIRAVDGATFSVCAGEILGLIGPNGAGKTTILDLVSGFLRPDAGRIVLSGGDVTRMSPEGRSWNGIGRSFQDARLVPSLTVAENLALGLDRHLPVGDHFASMFALPVVIDTEISVAWAVDDLIDLMGLGAYRDKFARELSTGTRRVVDLAMCLANGPAVLLLDEPTSGIAQREAEALGPLLRTIRQELGCALVVVEHDMSLITSISDRLLALDLGRPIASGTPAEVISDPRVVASYLGGDPATIYRSNSSNGHARTRRPLTAKATGSAR